MSNFKVKEIKLETIEDAAWFIEHNPSGGLALPKFKREIEK